MSVNTWTPERDATLAKLHGQTSDTEIAARLNVAKSTVQRRAKQLGLPALRTELAWTTTQIARLKEMWAAGYSASAIGAELGRTRNSVIGCVFRRNLQKRKTQIRRARRPRFKQLIGAAIFEVAADTSPHPPLNIPFIEAKDGQCREIVGHDGLALFCGHRTIGGTSFCPHHAFMNYQPARTSRPQHSDNLATQIRRNELLAA